ncbi:hypothetical protein KY285_032877 [Solanum tuberosum]|nr:hypothetical protein KY289_032989 [Solanum tuberosum]KAH0647629.1 hypothetical protein KY285_032877 [Solanum tuberosum]
MRRDLRHLKNRWIRPIPRKVSHTDLPNSPGTGKNHHVDKAPAGKTQAKLGEDSVLPTPISQNPPSMPNVLAGMDKEGNTKASKIKGIDSMLLLPLTPLDICLTVLEVVGVLDGGLEENITKLQEGVSKGGFLHHENLPTDPKKDPRDSATTSHQTTQENQHNQLINQGKVSGQGHTKQNDQQGNLNTSHNTQKKNQKKECSLERIGTKLTRQWGHKPRANYQQ